MEAIEFVKRKYEEDLEVIAKELPQHKIKGLLKEKKNPKPLY